MEENDVQVCLPALRACKCPRVFTKLMKPVVGLLRQLGIRLIIYLDVMLIMAQSRDTALQHASTALDLLQGLGFMINYLKSVLDPSTKMEFLGFEVDSLTLSLALPRDKIRNVRKECERNELPRKKRLLNVESDGGETQASHRGNSRNLCLQFYPINTTCTSNATANSSI